MVSRKKSSAYDAHAEVDLLLPWYVNGSLGEGEVQLVHTHLEVCLSCRRELAEQQKLHFAIRTSDATGRLPQRSFAKLAARINSGQPGTQTAAGGSTFIGRLMAQWRDQLSDWFGASMMRAVLPAFFLGAVAVLLPGSGGVGSWEAKQQDHRYRTLSDSASEPHVVAARATDISIAFRREVPVKEIERLASKVNASIVAGPDPLGLYTLRLKNDSVSPTILAEIRRDTGVLLAEPAMAASSNAAAAAGGRQTR